MFQATIELPMPRKVFDHRSLIDCKGSSEKVYGLLYFNRILELTKLTAALFLIHG